MSRKRLAEEIDRAVERWCREPFQWGRLDCLLSLADIIKAAHGYDPAEEYRGRYWSLHGAMNATRNVGSFGGALQRAAHQFSWPEIAPRDARIGDVGLISNGTEPRCGVIKHRRLWLSVHPAGYGFHAYPTQAVVAAWRTI